MKALRGTRRTKHRRLSAEHAATKVVATGDSDTNSTRLIQPSKHLHANRGAITVSFPPPCRAGAENRRQATTMPSWEPDTSAQRSAGLPRASRSTTVRADMPSSCSTPPETLIASGVALSVAPFARVSGRNVVTRVARLSELAAGSSGQWVALCAHTWHQHVSKINATDPTRCHTPKHYLAKLPHTNDAIFTARRDHRLTQYSNHI